MVHVLNFGVMMNTFIAGIVQTRTHVVVVLRVPSTIHHWQALINMADCAF
jgi:hypothetical protein